ncbi:MAG: NADP-dependent malic enzyme [Candidatus Magasanikbacteria bacterium]|nr:NADP-dependent malic enzyme [Candidatus Magasanikbacteria bacterium]
MTIFEESIAAHESSNGKLSVASRVPLNDNHDLAVYYTPGVAEVCREIARDPARARTLTLKHNTIAVISDGSAVLGLGNLGAAGAIPVMEGKAILFKKFADVDAFPICLDTQDTEEIIKAVKNIAPVFGGINLEDIAAPKCFEIERRLKHELNIPVVHDDQHGTAVVVLAALINALRLKNLDAEKAQIVINGAGAAGTAIAELLLAYGVKKIIVCDSQGIIHKTRKDLSDVKMLLAQITNEKNIEGTLADAVQNADIFIGVSVAGALTQDMVRQMAKDPIIIAMANPVPEIMPDEALAAGAFIVATGRSDFQNQINNVLAFPGIFRGALDNGITEITNSMFVTAAKNLAACVPEPTREKIIPSPFDAAVVPAVARAMVA